MLDRRAWIITGVIFLLIVLATVLWTHRTRTKFEGRSLSAAAPQPKKPETKKLHVDGCELDFLVKPTQFVEPRIAPGATPSQFRDLYGKESRFEKPGTLILDKYAYSLGDTYLGPNDSTQGKDNAIRIHLNEGHALQTLDDIELGIDSFGIIFRKMQEDHERKVHERLDRVGNNWVYTVSFYSMCGKAFRSEYSRTLPSNPDLDQMLAPKDIFVNGKTQPGTGPLRTVIFGTKYASDFALVPANGHDEADVPSPPLPPPPPEAPHKTRSKHA
jgi:hypothetical protein